QAFIGEPSCDSGRRSPLFLSWRHLTKAGGHFKLQFCSGTNLFASPLTWKWFASGDRRQENGTMKYGAERMARRGGAATKETPSPSSDGGEEGMKTPLSSVLWYGMPAWVSCLLCAATCVSLADSVTLHPVADTTLFETSPNNNLGAHTDFIAGTTAGSAGQPFRNRALLKFDIGGQIPTGATITSASLTLSVVKTPSVPANSTFGLHRLLVSWGEGNKTSSLGLQATTGEATWISRLFLLPQWALPGGKEGTDFLTDTSASTFVSGRGGYTFVSTSNLVADVQFWL